MSEKENQKLLVVRIEPIQFHNLLNTIDNLTQELRELKELKNITTRLTLIEGELRLIRMEIKEFQEKK